MVAAPQKREQMVLFSRRLDDAIAANHNVRFLDPILGRLDWTTWESAYHGRLGERPFAIIKHHLDGRRFLLRGLQNVRIEWRWLAAAFNLKRLISLVQARAGPEPNLWFLLTLSSS